MTTNNSKTNAVDDIDTSAAVDANQSTSRQFVTFVVRDETFAVPMGPVEEIIRMPDVVHVPLSPASLNGLANLRGKVLPVISLRTLFSFDNIDYDDATRVLVINHGTSVGFVVDRVASVMTVEAQQLEDVVDIQAAVDTDLLNGMIKDDSGRMIMVLDFERLLNQEFSDIAKLTKRAAAGSGKVGSEDDRELKLADDELHLVSFEVDQQEYALPIEQVQEIVQIPEHISQIPKTEAHVLGVMTLRNRLLPLVSLREMFALPKAPLVETNRIVVVSLDQDERQKTVGVVMDTVKEVLRVRRNVVDQLPNMLARTGDAAEITSICRLENGKRLVSVLSAEKMFDTQQVTEAVNAAEAAAGENEMAKATEMRSATVDDEAQLVVFRLADEEYGVPIDSVQEIVRVPEELTRVPKSPSFVEGVVNLRGTVLPVIDQRKRFGLAGLERNDRQRIMVFTIDGVRTGFIVDSVLEVLKIPSGTIESAPSLSEEQKRLIGHVANLQKDGRMILLLDTEELLGSKEVSALSAVA